MKKDNFYPILMTWSEGQDFVHYLNGLAKKKEFHQDESVFQTVQQKLQNNLRKHPEKRKNIAISNEALSSLYPTNETKNALDVLFHGYSVTVVIVHRSLPLILPSFYIEQRRINVRFQDFDGIQHRYGNEFAEKCHEDFVTYYTKIWDKPEFGDPLRTFETFSFFFESVVVLELNHRLKIDILEQFVCNAMDARNTCATLRELGPIQPLNKSTKKKNFLF